MQETKPRSSIPIVAIDGPSASGKGTLAVQLAKTLGFHYLDSGALYRSVAWDSHQAGIPWEESKISEILQRIQKWNLVFTDGKLILNGLDVTTEIRSDECADGASRLAQWHPIREALWEYQRSCVRSPGLVAEGRDMGSVVFTDAWVKVFLVADIKVRAQRRWRQLSAPYHTTHSNPNESEHKGEKIVPKVDNKSVNTASVIETGESYAIIAPSLSQVLDDLMRRDVRDRERVVSPLRYVPGAYTLDNTDLSPSQSKERVLEWCHKEGIPWKHV